MTMQRDEELFAVLLSLAGVTDAHRDSSVVDTLLGQGRSLLRAQGAIVFLDDEGDPPCGAGSSSPCGAGSSNRVAHDLWLASLRHGGPMTVAHRERRPVTFLADRAGEEAWERFTEEACRLGIRSVYAVPVAVGDRALGAYALLFRRLVQLTPEDARFAEALGRMAAVGLVNRRKVVEHEVREAQLQHALDSRVVIEQAKGMLAERAGIDTFTAFELMRATARAGGRRLSDIAEEVVRGMCWEPGTDKRQRTPAARSKGRRTPPRDSPPRT
ncbi:GAF and ANTAR domain-containing protein [Ornithinimicrobium sp. LYQ103]|uniref:GAF and ANTAR domain-containing protein n=1 Tax=Ornithinimicrobium sp. LYQ103 TaxID=3378796 RepID=UPI003853CE48